MQPRDNVITLLFPKRKERERERERERELEGSVRGTESARSRLHGVRAGREK